MGSKTNPGVIDCMAAALDDEEVFVLLARDPLAPWLVAIWASVRVGNIAAALDNFRMMASEDLLRHYQANPDIAKSREAMNVVQAMMDWRQANVGGPGETPRWKKSLVRPAPMMQLPGLPQPAPEIGAAQQICPVCQELTCECEEGDESHG